MNGYGPWGRGKTYLAERIADSLRSKHGYVIVPFNAWRYQSTPGLWAHLYQKCKREIVGYASGSSSSESTSYLRSAPAHTGLAIRIAVQRHGFWKLALCIWASFLTVIPVVFLFNILLCVIGLVGVGWLLLMLKLGRSGEKSFKQIFGLGQLGHYESHLGLQGAISDDISFLVKAVIPNGCYGSGWRVFWKVFCIFSVAILLAFSVLSATEYRDALFDSKWVTLPLPTVSDPKLHVPLVVWWVFLLYIAGSTICGVRRAERIILIVDDVDRCEPEKMLDVIESLKLLLDDPEIQNRLHVLMLIEDELLRQAIRNRFSAFRENDDSKEMWENYVREHIDKLFLCHLRLDELSDEDIVDIAERFVEATRGTQDGDTDNQNDESAHDNRLNVVLTQEEEKLLLKAISDIRGKNQQVLLSPRAVRLFFVKYQLAREILSELDDDWNVDEIVREIVNEYLGCGKAKQPESRIVCRVVASVM